MSIKIIAIIIGSVVILLYIGYKLSITKRNHKMIKNLCSSCPKNPTNADQMYTVKKKFAYLPVLVWDVPCKNGHYYRFIWLKNFYVIRKRGRWVLLHTYATAFTAENRAISLNAGYRYSNGTFYPK